MRELSKQEVTAVSGGALECSVGVPSGVSCKGSPGDFKDAAVRLWAISAVSPVSGPGLIMRVIQHLN